MIKKKKNQSKYFQHKVNSISVKKSQTFKIKIITFEAITDKGKIFFKCK